MSGSEPVAHSGTSWVIDTDPGLGLPWTDVDDALAILHLATQARVEALTTCFGNAPLHKVDPVARTIGGHLRLPVHTGAQRPGDGDTEAAEVLAAHRGSVLAIGPMTNIAAALARGARWQRLVLLGGAVGALPNVRPLYTSELNFALDEPSAAVALEACTDLVPMEPCRTVSFTAVELAGAPNWLQTGCRHWLRTTLLRPGGLAGVFRTGQRAFHPWDLLPAVLVTHPEAFDTALATVRLCGRAGFRGRISLADGSGHTRVVRAVDAAGLRAAWHQTVSAVAQHPRPH